MRNVRRVPHARPLRVQGIKLDRVDDVRASCDLLQGRGANYGVLVLNGLGFHYRRPDPNLQRSTAKQVVVLYQSSQAHVQFFVKFGIAIFFLVDGFFEEKSGVRI